ncbi:P-loop containing nucleoside triphosphate hydrolase protein [Annulohypoxylon maeteangense]|uniref:P-loop containing nucleoside triphosphate hydrolase protein n=1 Tax=Annulohypoxylon maeteangense TaxID=1927788 RepID=UPI002008DDAD|nr:P-loop containing nucleoside triphosphate hydrolase protein [Annulohypoxylon maeteangense]KAI0889025.1 P-loop containing nucleoside triphosphate hydrolase protein [Annulohypoxylon maeteangense]
MSTTEIIDDKSPICIPFILEQYKNHSASNPTSPFIIGLNGVQGAGKTTLVTALASKLQDGEGLRTLVCSIDDFYLRHEDQEVLATSHPDNLLVQVRGEPGTHDMNLARHFFTALREGQPIRVPQYDKSAYSGKGDRVPESQWEEVNGHGQPKIQVVIFEGWCVGFRQLDSAEVSNKWNAPSRTLNKHSLEHLNFINERLGDYDVITDTFNAFIHIDAEDTEWVYDWRLEQETMLRKQRGTGMTDDQVVKFVDAYYPAYELFSDRLREGLFSDKPGRQLRLIVGKDRKVKQTVII